MTGGELTGAEAFSAGLVARTVSAEELHAQALALGQQLAQLSPQALDKIRTGIDKGLEGTL
jgi:enoyl-CoA hydratase/carnithine racemase